MINSFIASMVNGCENEGSMKKGGGNMKNENNNNTSHRMTVASTVAVKF